MGVVEERVSGAGAAPTLSRETADEIAGLIYAYLSNQIFMADSKAQLTLAADALLATAIITFNTNFWGRLLDPATPPLPRLAALLLVGSLAALVLSIYYSLRVARPTLLPSKQPNLFYFVDVSRMTEAEFRVRFMSQTPDQITEALIEEVYLLSRIAYNKFNRVGRSINWLIVAFVLWGIAQVASLGTG